MTSVHLRDKNNLITIAVAGKVPIRGRTSSNQYFHTPLELLLCSLGLCVGGIINNFCRVYDINPLIFEDITISFDGFIFIVSLTRPSDFKLEFERLLEIYIKDCSIARELKKDLSIKWGVNSAPVEKLIARKEKPCCGGN
jgi:uncharacterized OsmC-like protein